MQRHYHFAGKNTPGVVSGLLQFLKTAALFFSFATIAFFIVPALGIDAIQYFFYQWQLQFAV